MRMFKPSVSAVREPGVKLIRPLCPIVALQMDAMRDCELLLSISGEIKQELSWVGKVTPLPTGDMFVYHVTEVALVKQLVSPVSTILDAMALAQLAERWMDLKIGYNPLKFLAHSHPGNSPDPSSRDEETMNSFIRGPATPPFLVRGIFAVWATEALVDFTVFDYQKGVMFCHVPWRVVDDDRRSALEQLVEEHVSCDVRDMPVTAPGVIRRGGRRPSPASCADRGTLIKTGLRQGGLGDGHNDVC